jgi:hypothetical protein
MRDKDNVHVLAAGEKLGTDVNIWTDFTSLIEEIRSDMKRS